MEYNVGELAKLSGVSPRTLRYYDGIGLLRPERTEPNGYRVYGRAQVDLLQQILFYRELGMELEDIKKLLYSPGFDRELSMKRHLSALLKRQKELGALIENVRRSLSAMKGETNMTDSEKFQGFKRELIEKNEREYGREVREKYGEDALASSNAKLAGMSERQWQEQQEITQEMFALLKAAMAKNDPACDEAQRAVELHRRWLCMFWKDGAYSKPAHLCLAESHVYDPRFKAYYEKELGEGGAEFFRDAVAVYAK